MPVSILDGPDAIWENLEYTLEVYDPILVTLLGHGSEGVFTGHGGEVVMSVCAGPEILTDRVVVALSCRTGARLGPDAVDKGCLAYFGWTQDFVWVTTEEADPARDHYAPAFFEPVDVVIISLANGLEAMRAYEEAIRAYERWIEAWAKSDDPYAGLVVMWLIHDRDTLVLVGTPSATIIIAPWIRVPATPAGAMALGVALVVSALVA